MFQFHIGAIKSDDVTAQAVESTTFQFHIGAIKSEAAQREQMSRDQLFQFHIGAIKRGWKKDIRAIKN